MARVAPSGPAMPTFSPEMLQPFRKAFFEAMASTADQVMRSDGFRAALKQSMDQTLAWQQAMNQLMQTNLQSMQMPTRGDADQLVAQLRGLESRLADRFDDLSRRIDALEGSAGGGASNRGKPAKASS